jgi:hypothetical protein
LQSGQRQWWPGDPAPDEQSLTLTQNENLALVHNWHYDNELQMSVARTNAGIFDFTSSRETPMALEQRTLDELTLTQNANSCVSS